jgi:hypothetical protein
MFALPPRWRRGKALTPITCRRWERSVKAISGRARARDVNDSIPLARHEYQEGGFGAGSCTAEPETDKWALGTGLRVCL